MRLLFQIREGKSRILTEESAQGNTLVAAAPWRCKKRRDFATTHSGPGACGARIQCGEPPAVILSAQLPRSKCGSGCRRSNLCRVPALGAVGRHAGHHVVIRSARGQVGIVVAGTTGVLNQAVPAARLRAPVHPVTRYSRYCAPIQPNRHHGRDGGGLLGWIGCAGRGDGVLAG